MDSGSKRMLVLYWHDQSLDRMRAAIRHHLHVLDHSPAGHDILYYNARFAAPSWLRHCRFDAVLLHTTFLCMRWNPTFYRWKWELRWIQYLNCVKIALPQDEYDHSEILDEWLFEWNISIVFTNFDEAKRKILYPLMHARAVFYECFTGYIDDSVAAELRQKIDLQPRPYDLVYRATHLPYWFGSHGQLKHQIADVVTQRAQDHGLRCDISTRPEDTIVGDDWLKFLASGRAVVGCESGSSVMDRRGEIKAQIQAIQRKQPTISFDEIRKQLPEGWDDHQFFALSPRHFEAIITKTCQILVEGRYDGIFEPDIHYISLKRDFSNLDEVLERMRDEDAVLSIAERAYQDIYVSGRYTYRRLAADIERALLKQDQKRQETSHIFSQFLWPLAEIRSHLATESVNAYVRYERFKESLT